MHENYRWDTSVEEAELRFTRKHGVKPEEVLDLGWAVIAGPIPSTAPPIIWNIEESDKKEKPKEKEIETEVKKKKCLYCSALFVSKGNRKFCCRDHRILCSGGRENLDSRNRYLILERDGFQCVYRGVSPRTDEVVMCLDHVIPLSKGGETKAYNLIAACKSCNSAKGNHLLKEDTQKEILAEIKRRNKEIGIENNLDIRLKLEIDF